jgi:hypothetical protein
MARDVNNKTGANPAPQTAIHNEEGGGDGDATRRDWNFQDEDEDGDQEEELFLPPSQKFRPNSIDHLDEQMRYNGLRWRHELKRRAAKDPSLQSLLTWIQHHPSPMDEPTRTLAEMVSAIKAIPRRKADRLMDMGDGNMLMPITMFEHFIHPMAYLRHYLEGIHEEKPAGGIECALIYSFFMQHQALPHDRTEEEIILLRATALASDESIPHQINNSSDTVTGLSMAMANTLDKLEDECAMPNFRTVQSWSRAQAEACASAVKTTIDLYREQATRDYHLLRSTKERNIVPAHLAHKQSLENLDLNSRLLRMIQEKESRMETNIGAGLKKAPPASRSLWTRSLKIASPDLKRSTIKCFNNSRRMTLKTPGEYSTNKCSSSTHSREQTLALVSENSRLRIHHSFLHAHSVQRGD